MEAEEKMTQILILTKNVSADEELEKMLKSLNYEVLISQQLYQSFSKRESALAQIFGIVIFSKTICDNEMERLLQTLKESQLKFLREDTKRPELEQEEYWRNLNINGWLVLNDSYHLLRETLYQLHQIEESVEIKNTAVKNDFSNLKKVVRSLPKNEKLVMKILYESKDSSITREEIAEKMWPQKVTNSRISQVAQLIQRIRQKFARFNLGKDFIVTNWGFGYQLDKKFYEIIQAQDLSVHVLEDEQEYIHLKM